MTVERLTFNLGRSRSAASYTASRRGAVRRSIRQAVAQRARTRVAAVRERYDADYLWMLAFTFLLFFRPQDQIPGLQGLHLSELTAIGALAAMATRRLSAGQTIAKMNAEVVAIIGLGAVILFTVPFSTWPGGSARMFSDIYVRIILFVVLMISTTTSPRRIRQTTWLMLIASGYISARAVFDYARGVNLVEGDRVRGAIGGIFANPNDLALNLVAFMAPALFIMLQDRKVSRRLFAGGLAVVMFAAIICTKSRSGFMGLIGMGLVVSYYMVRLNPGALFAILFAALVALPVAPASFWNRMDTIVNGEPDSTGSREARIHLIEQGIEVFFANPITGVGAGQFQNYDMKGVTVEKWRVTHNVWLQVAAELGIFGLAFFVYLVYRGFYSCAWVNRTLRGPRRTRAPAVTLALSDDERKILSINAKGMTAALVGWVICATFASVAFNWTFYYLLTLAVAGREVAASRRQATVQYDANGSSVTPFVRVHA